MKKLILLFALSLIFTLQNSAQNTVITMTGSGDTVKDAGTDYVQLQVKKWYKSVSIQAIATKVGGTVAGTALLQGSNDGLNFLDMNTDTLQLTDITTNTKVWVVNGSPYSWYRITYLGVGTDTFKIAGYLLANAPYVGAATNVVSNLKSSYGLNSDTVVNSATNTLLIAVQQGYESVSIQAVVTKISGTAGGTVTLQGSNNGINYVTVSTGYLENVATGTPYTTGGGATLTVLNQTTTSKLFTLIGSPYKYYRLSYTGTGTMSCSLKGYLLANK